MTSKGMKATHPLATTVPSVEALAQNHVNYMLRLAQQDRDEATRLIEGLNIPELLQIAGTSLGSECYKLDKIYQGGFNQIFNLTFRDPSMNAIARINMPSGGGHKAPEQERRDRVASEAATLKWLRQNTTIPVPQVFTYDSDPSNIVGATFMIQEKIIGRPLSDIWVQLPFKDRRLIILQLAQFQRQLYCTSFPKIGSLYEDLHHPTQPHFYVGRSAPPVRIERTRVNRGPWATPREEMVMNITEQLTELCSGENTVQLERQANKADNTSFNIEEFRQLYVAILDLVNKLDLFDHWKPRFSLSHPDYNLHNILVGYEDPTCVVGMIDWEGTRVQPWWQTSPIADFLWDDFDLEDPADPSDSGSALKDALAEWSDILRNADGLPGHGSIACTALTHVDGLVDGDYATWATMEQVVKSTVEWRSAIPRKYDPAFAKLDALLHSHSADFYDC